jgi:hypothetical protein
MFSEPAIEVDPIFIRGDFVGIDELIRWHRKQAEHYDDFAVVLSFLSSHDMSNPNVVMTLFPIIRSMTVLASVYSSAKRRANARVLERTKENVCAETGIAVEAYHHRVNMVNEVLASLFSRVTVIHGNPEKCISEYRARSFYQADALSRAPILR